MRWLVCLAVLVCWMGSGEAALAQRGPVYRPPPRIEPYRPSPRIEPMPMPRVEPPTAVQPPQTEYSPEQDPGQGDSDGDGDGYAMSDCNDLDPSVHPGAYDPPGGRDMDCDGDPDS